jgi:ATP synthase protein I
MNRDSLRRRDRGELARAVTRRRVREERWRREGERPLARNLALVGTLGWLVALPALIGAIAGRSLDRRAGTGVAFTFGLMAFGIALGSYLAWRRVEAA